MKGLILINAYSRMKDALYCADRLKEEFEKRGVTVDVRRNDFFAVTVSERLGLRISGYDFCVYLDKDKYVLQALEKAGIPLFNNFRAIEACDDKMTTSILLAENGIPMPKTLPGIFCYDRDAEISGESIAVIEETLGYPLVVKSCYGSCGEGVCLVKDREELKKINAELLCTPHLFQQFIASSAGRDVRVIVIGGKVFGAILRSSEKDFRSNVALGGSVSEYPISGETVSLCEKIARLLELSYCGIDLLFGADGKMLVSEVNSNAFFGGFERATRKNVAAAFADHILAELRKR